jgi:hypothetical protein
VLEGLKLGLGTMARTWREGDNENDYRLPGFVKWGALARYEWPWARGQLALQLNVDNLWASTLCSLRVAPPSVTVVELSDR